MLEGSVTVDAIEVAELAEVENEVVVAPRLKLVSPLLQQGEDVGQRLVDGGCLRVAVVAVGSSRGFRLAVGVSLRVLRLVRLLGVDLFVVGSFKKETVGVWMEDGIRVVG